MMNYSGDWVCKPYEVLAPRLKLCLAILVTNGVVGVGQASAQELVDVAALEAQVEAAAELAELPAEPDWGVQDLSDSLPVVEQDAPEVPSAAPAAIEPVPAPQYHAENPQYHTEYHAPESNPVPPPINAPAPDVPDGEPVQAPTASVPTQAPVEPTPSPPTPQTSSTPTIWIWVWNWTWVQGTDQRYRNSDDQYHSDVPLIEQNLARITERVGIQMPVQIGVQTSDDIVEKLVRDIGLEGADPGSAPAAAPAAPMPTTDYRRPAKIRTSAPSERGRPTRARATVERSAADPVGARSVAPQLLSSARAAPVSRQAKGSKPPRARRASRPAPTLPRPAERFADSGTASSASAGIFLKSFAILIASLLLTAMGRGRRLRLPSTRPLGLLGSRTDPFG
jgi:hypothetical protein